MKTFLTALLPTPKALPGLFAPSICILSVVFLRTSSIDLYCSFSDLFVCSSSIANSLRVGKPQSSLICVLSLDHLIHWHHFNYHHLADNFKICISNLDPYDCYLSIFTTENHREPQIRQVLPPPTSSDHPHPNPSFASFSFLSDSGTAIPSVSNAILDSFLAFYSNI